MKAYEDTQERKGKVVSDILIDRSDSYDNMRQTLIGIRNSAWAERHNDNFKAKLFYHLSNAILTDDKDLIGIMTAFPIVEI